jgi:small-conductance mechanosensitive channel
MVNKSEKISLILIYIFIFLLLLGSSSVYAWDNCPFGEVNETYPGSCGRYIDTDNDNICDLSQSPPGARIQVTEGSSNEEQNQSIDETNTSLANSLNYYFLPILLLLFLFYILTYSLSKKLIIKKNYHRKFWNVILLVTFLISGLFGIILALSISSGIRLSFYADLLFWHVEFGIAMAIISFFHVAWHWNYYKKIIVKKDNC